jgi:hypothetical protein
MNGIVFFLLLPMIDIPIMWGVVAWLKNIRFQYRLWVLHRALAAIRQQMEIVNTRAIKWEKGFQDWKKRVEIENAIAPALQSRLRAIQRDLSTPARAKLFRDEVENLNERSHRLRERGLVLLKERETVDSMEEKLMEMMKRVEEMQHRWMLEMLGNTTVHTCHLLVTDNHP